MLDRLFSGSLWRPALGVLAAVVPLLSGLATETVTNAAPQITTQPAGKMAFVGSTVQLTSVASGTEPLVYQWQKDGTNISSATSPYIILLEVTTNDTGSYSLVVSNAFGSVVSEPALLTVNPYYYRQLRLGAVGTNAAGRLLFPIELVAEGGENQVGFSLAFAPNVLLNLEPALTVDPSDTNVVAASTNTPAVTPTVTFTTNLTELAQGRVGMTVALSAGATFTTGTHRLGSVACDLAGGRTLAQAALAMGGNPVPFQVKDVDGNALLVDPAIVLPLLSNPVASAPNLQSGLFLQSLSVVNAGLSNAPGIRILVHDTGTDSLSNNVILFNATGLTNGLPYLELGPLAAGGTVALTAEYYISDRKTIPSPRYEVQVMPPAEVTITTNTVIALDRALFANGSFLVEFNTSTNCVYYVQYVGDATDTNWATSLPGIAGTGSRIQWVDNGPPKTASRPASQPNRFYRIIQYP